ncbi:MAG: hypothetical protein KA841_01230 [Chitinophagales bacterium]|nr:hypothetical protein [Chitinophagales bacterium]
MNLLFELVKHLPHKEFSMLTKVAENGVAADVWRLMLLQRTKPEFDREYFQNTLSISSTHLDKLTSVLLSRCYELLFNNNTLELLDFLSKRTPFNKHYYHELNRQIKRAEATLDNKGLAEFYKANMSYIQLNMPIIFIDDAVLKKLSVAYLKVDKSANAKLLVECKLLYVTVCKQFAAATIKGNQDAFRKRIDALELPADADEELVFAHFWLKSYYHHACENFELCSDVLKTAIRNMKKFTSEKSKLRTFQMELKLAEMQYYNSHFEESFRSYKKNAKSAYNHKIPDYSYHITKYLQICLITGHLDEAREVVQKRILQNGKLDRNALLPRDIISVAKYFLFEGNYALAHEFILLGFEKNPKGKYFQYEVELRNLQTACFYLEGQQDVALSMCRKHVRFLTAHGYGVDTSNFPFYYLLIKSFAKSQKLNKSLSPQDLQMLDRYQKGSYAIYGKLLLKMRESA